MGKPCTSYTPAQSCSGYPGRQEKKTYSHYSSIYAIFYIDALSFVVENPSSWREKRITATAATTSTTTTTELGQDIRYRSTMANLQSLLACCLPVTRVASPAPDLRCANFSHIIVLVLLLSSSFLSPSPQLILPPSDIPGHTDTPFPCMHDGPSSVVPTYSLVLLCSELQASAKRPPIINR